MNSLLETLARKLVTLINETDFDLETAISETVHELDVLLTDMQKQRADYPEHIAHGKKIAEAYASDFQMDDEPEVEPSDDPNAVWLSCWMLVTKNPETGNFT